MEIKAQWPVSGLVCSQVSGELETDTTYAVSSQTKPIKKTDNICTCSFFRSWVVKHLHKGSNFEL